MKKKWIIIIIVAIIPICFFTIYWIVERLKTENETEVEYEIGEPIDSFNNIPVYYNGGVKNNMGRNTVDGYNLGVKYQCVEFVKRYYFVYYHHRMPDTWGHAKDFFDKDIGDGEINTRRDLLQFSNPSKSKPQVGDLLVLDGTHGHVAIISEVEFNYIVVIQQNCGTQTRRVYYLKFKDGWYLDNTSILGWLRKG